MTDFVRLFDSYNRQARIYPALISLSPPLLILLAWHPDLLTSGAAKTLLTLAISCGLLYALASLARAQGKIAEERLLRNWGGWPTTLWLRHSDASLPSLTKLRYHAALRRCVPGLTLPTAAEEQVDPKSADSSYLSAVGWLKERTRGEIYPRVAEENAEYGFRRNLRGLRWFGLAAAVLPLAASVVKSCKIDDLSLNDLTVATLLHTVVNGLQTVPALVWGAMFIDSVAMLFWIFVVRDRWVRQAADQYARALLAACETI